MMILGALLSILGFATAYIGGTAIALGILDSDPFQFIIGIGAAVAGWFCLYEGFTLLGQVG